MTVDRARGIVLPGAAEVPAASQEQLLAGLSTALANRVVGATAMNSGDPQCLDHAVTAVTLPLAVSLVLFHKPDSDHATTPCAA